MKSHEQKRSSGLYHGVCEMHTRQARVYPHVPHSTHTSTHKAYHTSTHDSPSRSGRSRVVLEVVTKEGFTVREGSRSIIPLLTLAKELGLHVVGVSFRADFFSVVPQPMGLISSGKSDQRLFFAHDSVMSINFPVEFKVICSFEIVVFGSMVDLVGGCFLLSHPQQLCNNGWFASSWDLKQACAHVGSGATNPEAFKGVPAVEGGFVLE